MNPEDIRITETARTFFTRDLAVTIPASLVEGRIAEEIEDVRRVYTRPGFRPGRVPHDVIRRHLGAAIRTRMIDKLVDYGAARATDKLCLVGEPETEVLSITGDVELTVSVRHRPELPCPCGIRGLRFTASLDAYYSAMGPLDTEAVSDFCGRTIAELDRYRAQQKAAA
jgi:FKBP-type peptidyl-prolyl cis-trans isomerase (trigger factor)